MVNINKRTIKIVTGVTLFTLSMNLWPMWAARANDRPQSVVLNVPYTSQAPLGQWSDPRQADGCEEASIVMAMTWARGGSSVVAEEAARDIINMSDYEQVIFGFYQDTSAQDTARLLQEFYRYEDVRVKENISSEDVKQELADNRVVIIPLDTRLTGLAMYHNGPPRHTIVATGYDDSTNSIRVNDPYYRGGQGLWIPAPALDKALWNYLSGPHLGLGERRTALISVGKMPIIYK